jgi:hypothetical protein
MNMNTREACAKLLAELDLDLVELAAKADTGRSITLEEITEFSIPPSPEPEPLVEIYYDTDWLWYSDQ